MSVYVLNMLLINGSLAPYAVFPAANIFSRISSIVDNSIWSLVANSVDGDNMTDLLKGLNEYFIPFHCGVMSVTVSEFPITGVVGFVLYE